MLRVPRRAYRTNNRLRSVLQGNISFGERFDLERCSVWYVEKVERPSMRQSNRWDLIAEKSQTPRLRLHRDRLLQVVLTSAVPMRSRRPVYALHVKEIALQLQVRDSILTRPKERTVLGGLEDAFNKSGG
jgi:hypothetical protein